MYALEKFNVLHKRFFNNSKNDIRESLKKKEGEEYFTLDCGENIITSVESPNEFTYGKNKVNVIMMNGVYYEVTDIINLQDLKHLSTDMVPSFLSMELKQGDNVFDIKELLPLCLYDGMTLSDGLLRFMLLQEHNYAIISDDDSLEYTLEIIDCDANQHIINLKENYVVLDSDRGNDFFTLKK
jgi:hypothetical protein